MGSPEDRAPSGTRRCLSLRRKLELYLESELHDVGAAAELRAHLDTCLECRRFAERYEELTLAILESEVPDDVLGGPQGEPLEAEERLRLRSATPPAVDRAADRIFERIETERGLLLRAKSPFLEGLVAEGQGRCEGASKRTGAPRRRVHLALPEKQDTRRGKAEFRGRFLGLGRERFLRSAAAVLVGGLWLGILWLSWRGPDHGTSRDGTAVAPPATNGPAASAAFLADTVSAEPSSGGRHQDEFASPEASQEAVRAGVLRWALDGGEYAEGAGTEAPREALRLYGLRTSAPSAGPDPSPPVEPWVEWIVEAARARLKSSTHGLRFFLVREDEDVLITGATKATHTWGGRDYEQGTDSKQTMGHRQAVGRRQTVDDRQSMDNRPVADAGGTVAPTSAVDARDAVTVLVSSSARRAGHGGHGSDQGRGNNYGQRRGFRGPAVEILPLSWYGTGHRSYVDEYLRDWRSSGVRYYRVHVVYPTVSHGALEMPVSAQLAQGLFVPDRKTLMNRETLLNGEPLLGGRMGLNGDRLLGGDMGLNGETSPSEETALNEERGGPDRLASPSGLR